MTYTLKLFAVLKDKVGSDTWQFQSEKPLTGSGLLSAFFDANPQVDGLRKVTRLAVNQSFCSGDPQLNPSDELALIPPVSGG